MELILNKHEWLNLLKNLNNYNEVNDILSKFNYMIIKNEDYANFLILLKLNKKSFLIYLIELIFDKFYDDYNFIKPNFESFIQLIVYRSNFLIEDFNYLVKIYNNEKKNIKEVNKFKINNIINLITNYLGSKKFNNKNYFYFIKSKGIKIKNSKIKNLLKNFSLGIWFNQYYDDDKSNKYNLISFNIKDDCFIKIYYQNNNIYFKINFNKEKKKLILFDFIPKGYHFLCVNNYYNLEKNINGINIILDDKKKIIELSNKYYTDITLFEKIIFMKDFIGRVTNLFLINEYLNESYIKKIENLFKIENFNEVQISFFFNIISQDTNLNNKLSVFINCLTDCDNNINKNIHNSIGSSVMCNSKKIGKYIDTINYKDIIKILPIDNILFMLIFSEKSNFDLILKVLGYYLIDKISLMKLISFILSNQYLLKEEIFINFLFNLFNNTEIDNKILIYKLFFNINLWEIFVDNSNYINKIYNKLISNVKIKLKLLIHLYNLMVVYLSDNNSKMFKILYNLFKSYIKFNKKIDQLFFNFFEYLNKISKINNLKIIILNLKITNISLKLIEKPMKSLRKIIKKNIDLNYSFLKNLLVLKNNYVNIKMFTLALYYFINIFKIYIKLKKLKTSFYKYIKKISSLCLLNYNLIINKLTCNDNIIFKFDLNKINKLFIDDILVSNIKDEKYKVVSNIFDIIINQNEEQIMLTLQNLSIYLLRYQKLSSILMDNGLKVFIFRVLKIYGESTACFLLAKKFIKVLIENTIISLKYILFYFELGEIWKFDVNIIKFWLDNNENLTNGLIFSLNFIFYKKDINNNIIEATNLDLLKENKSIINLLKFNLDKLLDKNIKILLNKFDENLFIFDIIEVYLVILNNFEDKEILELNKKFKNFIKKNNVIQNNINESLYKYINKKPKSYSNFKNKLEKKFTYLISSIQLKTLNNKINSFYDITLDEFTNYLISKNINNFFTNKYIFKKMIQNNFTPKLNKVFSIKSKIDYYKNLNLNFIKLKNSDYSKKNFTQPFYDFYFNYDKIAKNMGDNIDMSNKYLNNEYKFSFQNNFFINKNMLKCYYHKKLKKYSGLIYIENKKIIFIKEILDYSKNNNDFLNFKMKSYSKIYYKIKFEDIENILERKFLQVRSGFEIYLKSGKSYLFNLINLNSYKLFKNKIIISKNNNINKIINKWQNKLISNYEYLISINIYGGRSFNNLSQYPFMPIISLNKEFRDLMKPIGMHGNEDRIQLFKERIDLNSPNIEKKFCYATHFCSPLNVLNYLIRLYPYHKGAKHIQNGNFDIADRIFSSINDTIYSILNHTIDIRELIPEFYNKPLFLINYQNLNFGKNQNGLLVNNVILNEDSKKNPYYFIYKNRYYLESEDQIKNNLSSWVDLMFGCKQLGVESEKTYNVFNELTYEKNINWDKIPEDRINSIKLQITHFGQMPFQLFQLKSPIVKNIHKTLIDINSNMYIYSNLINNNKEISNKTTFLHKWSKENDKYKFLININNEFYFYSIELKREFNNFETSLFKLKKINLKEIINYRIKNCKTDIKYFILDKSTLFIYGFYNGVIIIYSLEQNMIIKEIQISDKPISNIFKINENKIFVVNFFGEIKFIKFDQKLEIDNIKDIHNSFNKVLFIKKIKDLIFYYTINEVYILNKDTFKIIFRMEFKNIIITKAFLTFDYLPCIIIFDEKINTIFSFSLDYKLISIKKFNINILQIKLLKDKNFNNKLIIFYETMDIISLSVPFFDKESRIGKNYKDFMDNQNILNFNNEILLTSSYNKLIIYSYYKNN